MTTVPSDREVYHTHKYRGIENCTDIVWWVFTR